MSSINDGLFILEVDWAQIEAEKAAGVKYEERRRYRDVVSGQGDQCPPVDVDVC